MKFGFLGLMALAALWVAGNSNAQEGGGSDNLSNLIDGGELDLSFRYRYEFVDDDGFSKDADASTLRTRLSLQSGEYRDFDVFLEVDDVHQVIEDDYNAGAGNSPSKTDYPVVADPEGTEINQVYLDYNGFENVGIRAGRQRINFDNQRFIGGVGWRQNEQTYEGVKFTYQGNEAHNTEGITADYAYITRVRRIFGDDVPAGTHDQDGTHFLHVSGGIGGVGKLAGYYYLIDNEDSADASTSTFGARLTGKKAINEEFTARYLAEYAMQRDAADNPADFSADYWVLDVGLLTGIYDVGIGMEVLTGDENSVLNEAFRTPFATLHAFNGWADKFLTTPSAGLEDMYVKFKATPGPWTLQLRYHDFDSEDASDSLGDEIDLQVGYKFDVGLKLDAYLAQFDGDSGITDTQKIFLQLSFAL